MSRTLGRLGAALASLLLAVLSCTVAAQTYPDRPIRMILPFPPGGPSDILGRALSQQLADQLGQNVLPDNHAGAGGNIGLAVAARSPADGYTIVLSSPTIAVSPSLYAHLNYSASQLAPVARLARIQNVLIVHPSVPVKTLGQFIKLARSHPGKLTFGSGGIGTTNHLANELLKKLAHINMVHVPYKGASRAMLALIGGQVDEVVVAVPAALAQIRAGKVRPLAVLSDKRVPQLPNVPTSAEAGVKGLDVAIWYGMFAPVATPHAIVTRLNEEIVKALHAPNLTARLTQVGVAPWPGSPEQLKELVASETKRYAALIKSIGLKPR